MESIEVKDYMNHYPVTFTAEMVVEEAALRFLKTKQIGGPVIDGKNRVIGFLSESDVLATMLQTIYHNEHVSDVAALMRKEVLSVKPSDSVIELAQSMLQNKPKVYPVVDEDGILLGTICRNDVLYGIDRYTRSTFKP
ncbi:MULTISPECIES: CBS domain-containing protein [unclassified Colwellia]|uniref:CBS domain-containing protein n=1 Tax=unclassified Colwellia TaxID=196834 RepID=UPI0015F732F9|nr:MULTISPECIES: CBS domain-containing protein [unclassified Colwellia]MBA6233892.1 CBS domain-containing protein [Colwellia sp. MB02u-7]MBA6237634.1 CBS domain-containing protein [Colwellia sp. MB02u-11]MBA6256031.1 CBS domain-containing protein [Colwellia sp. MB3u-28]MBA6259996.1 CBS domain-containing protein [Colwellia sp. MB3u-41]MBA6300565.1 CBS domain-containing protein [Colwellia sp. MB3u-22]